MKRNKIIFSIVFITFFILAIFVAFMQYKQSEYVQIKKEQSNSILKQVIDGKIIFFRKLLSKRVQFEIYNNEILEKSIISNDELALKKEFSKIYKILKRENKYIKVLHYISPENIYKYNFHDSIQNKKMSVFRKIVKESNRLKRAKYGFEVGDTDLLYRLEIPLAYNGKYYGLIELGVSPELFISDMTTIEKYLDATLIIDSEKIIKYDDYPISKRVTHKSNGYVILENKPLFKKILDNSLVDNPKTIKFDENYYDIFTYTLFNFDGSIEGKILFSTYVTDDKKWERGLNILGAIILIVIFIIFFVVIYFGFNFYDKKIKKLIEHDKQNERLLFQQSKMASMGEMIGNIAHQWRQPLSTITTAASGMKLQKEFGMLDDKQFFNAIENIMEQATYMSKTIDDFRSFFKSDKDKIKFNVKDSIEKDIKLLEATLKNSEISVKLNFDDKVEIVGHQNEFTQAILNILNNAKDQLKKADVTPKVIKIDSKIKDNKLKIYIVDNGGGIKADIVDKIFEPYFTTKHQSQGTGIGLFMTSEIISKHFLGTIDVENRIMLNDGESLTGACFIITIPLT